MESDKVLKKLEEQLELLSRLSKKGLPEPLYIEVAEEIRRIAETYFTISHCLR